MELHNPLIKGTFILTVTGLLTRFMGFFYRIFLSHTFGAVQVGLYQLIFPFMLLAIPQLVPESRQFSPAVLPAVLFRAEKKKPASFSIPDFSSRCPSPAVLQFFCKNSRHFWLALYLATEDVNLSWSCFLTFFLSVLYIAVLPDTASA